MMQFCTDLQVTKEIVPLGWIWPKNVTVCRYTTYHWWKSDQQLLHICKKYSYSKNKSPGCKLFSASSTGAVQLVAFKLQLLWWLAFDGAVTVHLCLGEDCWGCDVEMKEGKVTAIPDRRLAKRQTAYFSMKPLICLHVEILPSIQLHVTIRVTRMQTENIHYNGLWVCALSVLASVPSILLLVYLCRAPSLR